MADQAHKETDRMMDKVLDRVRKEYKVANKEIQEKLDDYLQRFAIKDKIKQEQVKSGKITQDEYIKWRTGQIMIGKRWEEMRDTIAADYSHANQIAMSIVNGYTPDVYALNHNYGTYEAEKGALVDTSYTLYDRQTVERLIRDNPDLLPKATVDIPKDQRWNKNKVTSAVMQGVIQGEDITKISKRLQQVTNMNETAAVRNARTMTTSAENGGRQDSYTRAESMGIKMKKQWMATLDSTTRDSHAIADGQVVGTKDTFHLMHGELEYPGDPAGPPAEVYNCRCTMVAVVDGVDPSIRPDAVSRNSKLGGMTYDEWKEEHQQRADARTARAQKSEQTADTANTMINGKDISAAWERRPDQFDFEIEDVINAQGFDGKPRVVSAEEFDKAVKAANNGNGFIAQRTYSAPDQETLDAYRDQLYNGKWYVDCSTGGAQHGQGMYCAGNYEGKLTEAIKQEMKDYQNQNLTYSGEKSVHAVETMTLDKSAKIINQKDLVIEWAKEYYPSMVDWWTQTGGPDNIQDAAIEVAKNIRAQELVKDGLAKNDFKATKMLNNETKGLNYIEERNYWLQKAEKAGILTDNGSYATLKGYDAIRTNHGTSGADTIILNRTKVIFKGE